jgi:hypothetical protein
MFVISVSRFYVAKLSSRKNIINSQAFPFPSHYLDGTSEYTFAFIFKERNLIRIILLLLSIRKLLILLVYKGSSLSHLFFLIGTERTYSEPRKWMRGKGRVTIQFGCCYNYAVVISKAYTFRFANTHNVINY